MHHPINKRMTYTVLVDRDHTFSHFIFPPKGVKIHKKKRQTSRSNARISNRYYQCKNCSLKDTRVYSISNQ